MVDLVSVGGNFVHLSSLETLMVDLVSVPV